MTDFIQVITTIDSHDKAKTIAQSLVERRLAACCQIRGPIESVYRWKEQIETAQEWQITIKSTRNNWPNLQVAIKELHSYETPEILVFDIVTGSDEYLQWLDEQAK